MVNADEPIDNAEDRSEDYEDVNSPQERLLEDDDELEHIELANGNNGEAHGEEHEPPR